MDNLLALARMGVTILPLMPAFYNNPASIDDILDHLVARVFDQFGLPAPHAHRWQGVNTARTADSGNHNPVNADGWLRQR